MVSKLFSRFWFKILIVYIGWLLIIFSFAFIFTKGNILPYTPSYPGVDFLQAIHPQPFLYRWAGFDGFHYLTIVQQGYLSATGIQAFFPLYPLLISLLTPIFSSPIIAGLLISSLSFYGFLLIAFKLINYHFGQSQAWWLITIFLISPASFFFLALYSESLFLLLAFATFYAYERKNFYLIAFFGFLLSATRIIGVLVPLAIAIDYLFCLYRSHQAIKRINLQQLFLLFLSGFGLFCYMLYLWFHFNDPFYFRTVQNLFGSGREINRFILLPQVYWRYFKIFYIGLPHTWKSYAIVQEFMLTTFYFFGLIYTFWQNFHWRQVIYPWSWWLFSFFAFIVPTLTGNFSSMTRYVLVSFIVSVGLAKFFTSHPRFGVLCSFFSFLLLLINLLLFLQGFWVA